VGSPAVVRSTRAGHLTGATGGRVIVTR